VPSASRVAACFWPATDDLDSAALIRRVADGLGDGLSVAELLRREVPPEAFADFRDAVFLHAPEGLAASFPPRLACYPVDCVRAVVGEARAASGQRTVRLLLLAPSTTPIEGPAWQQLAEALGQDNLVRLFLVDATPARRLVMMAACAHGGIAAGPEDGMARWACLAGRTRAFVPLFIEPSAAASWGPRVEPWRMPGDLLTSSALPAMEGRCADLEAPVFWINLDRQEGRRRHLEAQLGALGVRWHRRVSAIDGALGADVLAEILRPNTSTCIRTNACVASHLLAMRRFSLEFPEEPYAIVLEDDASFELAHLWRKTLAQHMRDVDRDHPGWRIVQLSGIVCDPEDLVSGIVSVDRAVPRAKSNWFGAAAYAVSRRAVDELLAAYVREESEGSAAVLVDLTTLAFGSKIANSEEVFFQFSRTAECGPCLFLPLVSYLGSTTDIGPENTANHPIARGRLRELFERK
jgi:GR25 family glycosyltransferase involved in LPS biosynthesis